MKCTLLHPCVKGLHTFPCDEIYAVGVYCFVIYSTILNWPPICCSGYKLSFNGPTHLFCNVYHNKVIQRLVHRGQFLQLFLISKTLTTSSNGNIFRITGPLWGESTGDQWIPLTNSSDAGLWCFPFMCAWTNGWANSRYAGDLRRHSIMTSLKMRHLYDCTNSSKITMNIWIFR